MIPRYILNGEKLDYKNHLQLQYGNYCRVHKNETPHNIDKARNQGCKGDICLGSNGKRQDS